MSRLRPYQSDVKNGCYAAYERGAVDVMPVLATGSGKTVIVGDTVQEFDRPTAVSAHRQELVGQLSLALAFEGVRHNIIGDKGVIKAAVAAHVEEVGRSYFDPLSEIKVVGIDTLIRMNADADAWFRRVGLYVSDEGHHGLRVNKWGRGRAMFPNARGMFPTATPTRADGRGLGRNADGFIDEIIEGPQMRDLVNMGYLTDYRVFCPEVKVNLAQVHISQATGDYNQNEVRQAVHAAPELVGDVVAEYLKRAPGKLGVTFAVDVESAKQIAEAYRRAGVPAEVVTSKTPDTLRRSLIRRFKNREILQLVNVDLFGEGFDLPAIEVVSMARPTESYSLFAQQFGRALRLMISRILQGAWDTYTDAQRLQFIAESDKPYAIIIDHVGNVLRHGLPDRRREWTLDTRERGSRGAPSDAIPLRRCLNKECAKPYERIRKCCPYCGTLPPEPTERTSLKAVDGDLTELDPATLAIMRGDISKIDGPCYAPSGVSSDAAIRIHRNHTERQLAQGTLRHAIASWAALHPEDDDSENYRRFYFNFGIDVASAISLNARDAATLESRIVASIEKIGYTLTPPGSFH